MRSARLAFAHLFLVSFCLTAFAQDPRPMQLLTPDVGWVLCCGGLFWTTDSGKNWKNITPPLSAGQGVSSVFFLDVSDGWALLESGPGMEKGLNFEMAATTDGGATWSVTPFKIPDWDPTGWPLSGQAEIDFIDPLHGWMNLREVSSAAAHSGSTLVTDDGGKTWRWPLAQPPTAGSIRFIDGADGWVVSPEHDELWATHDGARSWQEVSLAPPKEEAGTNDDTYALPTFEDPLHGYLPVMYVWPDGTGSALALFRTSDGGRTWKPDRTVPHLPLSYGGPLFQSAVVGGELIVPLTSYGKLTLRTVASDGTALDVTGAVGAFQPTVIQMSFADETHAWAWTTHGGPFATSDGGATWTDSRPPAGKRMWPIGPPQGTQPNTTMRPLDEWEWKSKSVRTPLLTALGE